MRQHSLQWRTVDITVASVLGVAFGVVFWAWGLVWNGPAAAVFGAFKPAGALIYGVWLVPAVLGPLIIRRPGAGLYCELLAAAVSALLGSTWGLGVLVYGLVQGLAGEASFAALRYRVWRLPVAVVAAALAGLGAAVLDLLQYYSTWSGGWKLTYTVILVASSVVIAGVGGWALVRALAQTGVLDRFPSGRDRTRV